VTTGYAGNYSANSVATEVIHPQGDVSGLMPSVRQGEGVIQGAIRAADSGLGYQNPNCLTCHSKPTDVSDANYLSLNKYYVSDILSDTSRDATIAMAHVKMLPYITGAVAISVFPLKANSAQCRFCHQGVDTTHNQSAGNIRRDVNVELCVSCHGPSSTGSVFYQQ